MEARKIIGLLTALASAGCATVQTTHPGEVGVTRQQRIFLPLGDVNEAAASQYSQLVAKANQAGALDRDPAQTARVKRILRRLIAQTSVFRSDAAVWAWEMHVISDKQVNAWCMPGGKMVVYTGLLDAIRPSDDELAAVIGHEMAHALREHAREQMSEQLATGLLFDVATRVFKVDQNKAMLASLVMKVTFTLPHSREQEQEADRIGLELAARAGFDPAAAIAFWRKMERLGSNWTPEYLSTHPSPEHRSDDLAHYAERLKLVHEQAVRALAQRDVPQTPPPQEVAPATEVPSDQPARLSVGSRPLARILVNGEATGSNPLVGYQVRPGPVHLRFEVTDRSGTWSQYLTVTLQPGEQRNLGRIALAPPSGSQNPAAAYLSVGSQPLATIFVNGERLPSNPIVDYTVRPGKIRLRFEVRNGNGSWSQEMQVTLAPGEHRNLGRISLTRP